MKYFERTVPKYTDAQIIKKELDELGIPYHFESCLTKYVFKVDANKPQHTYALDNVIVPSDARP